MESLTTQQLLMVREGLQEY